MPLSTTANFPTVYVVKRTSGSQAPQLYIASGDSANQIDYQNARYFAQWDSGTLSWQVLILDTKGWIE
jgi:hypothetical protein